MSDRCAAVNPGWGNGHGVRCDKTLVTSRFHPGAHSHQFDESASVKRVEWDATDGASYDGPVKGDATGLADLNASLSRTMDLGAARRFAEAESRPFEWSDLYIRMRQAVYEALTAAAVFDPSTANWERVDASGAVVRAIWPLIYVPVGSSGSEPAK